MEGNAHTDRENGTQFREKCFEMWRKFRYFAYAFRIKPGCTAIMKRTIITCIAALLLLSAQAQAPGPGRHGWDSYVGRHSSVNSKEYIHIRTRVPGELHKRLTAEDRKRVVRISVSGPINTADLRILADLANRSRIVGRDGKDREAWLDLDLEMARLTEYGRVATQLPDGTFSNCRTLRSVLLPSNTEVVSSRLFSYCSHLEMVGMPEGVYSIGERAFYSCGEMYEFYMPNSVEEIGNSAFGSCSHLEQVRMPSRLRHIGYGAFESTRLSRVDLPNGLQSIGDRAFALTNLREVTLPSSLVEMGANAFNNAGFSAFRVAAGNSQFSEYDGMLFSRDGAELIRVPVGRRGNLTISNRVNYIGPSAMSGCSYLTSVYLPDDITEVSVGMFYGCSDLTDVRLSPYTQSIGADAFHSCTSLRTIDLPDGITRIGEAAFRNCKKLVTIKLPADLRYIEDHAFHYCTSLTEVNMPYSLVSIGTEAFDNCDALRIVSLPASVKSIGKKAFYNCNQLIMIRSRATMPPATDKICDNVKRVVLSIPPGTASRYKAASGWDKFKSVREE